jgi:hypothetical protein
VATNTKRRRIDADEEGNDLAPPPPDSPIAQLMYLLEWGRQRDFQIGPMVQIEGITVQVADLRRQKGGQIRPEGNIWKDHGHDKGDE